MKHQLPIDKTVRRLQKETHQFSYDADRLKKAYDMVPIVRLLSAWISLVLQTMYKTSEKTA